jgi:hypothetical protein
VSVRFVPLDAGREFEPGFLDRVLTWLETAAREVAPPLAAERIDAMVIPHRRVIPGWNCAGFGHGPWRIELRVEPDCAGRETRPLDGQLRAILGHELHHAMRERGPGYGRTLGEALVSEGLAQCYEEEVGCPTPNYATAVRGPALARLAALAKAEHSSDRYNHGVWFFGNPSEPAFPHWGGYSLGYVIVRRWLDEAGLPASQAVHAEAATILETAFQRPFA